MGWIDSKVQHLYDVIFWLKCKKLKFGWQAYLLKSCKYMNCTLFIKCKCSSIVWRGLSIDLQPSLCCCSAMSHEGGNWQSKGGKSMLTLSNSRVSWKEGKPMQHWCCPLSSPYFSLYCTCDWHPNSEKTNAIQLCCPAPTDVCTFDIPFLGKPMQLHCWCCLAPTTVCIPEQAFRRSAVQFPRWVIPNRRTMKRDLCPISATSAPNLVEGPFKDMLTRPWE